MEKVPSVSSAIKIKKEKMPQKVARKVKAPAVNGKTSGKRRKKAKLKKPEEFMLYKVPEIEECLEFCDSHNATWEVQRQQLRVFCDYMRGAAINAQQKEKKLKKGDAIERASTLASANLFTFEVEVLHQRLDVISNFSLHCSYNVKRTCTNPYK